MRALCAPSNQWPLTVFADRLVDAGDEAVGDRQSGQDGEIALGDAEGHVGARGVAPFGDQAAALQDQAGRPAARHDRPGDLAPGPRLVPLHDADIAPVRIVEAARPRAVAGERETDGALERGGIETCFGGCDLL